MKIFLNSFGNFAFCLKFHLQQFSSQWKFQKFPSLPPPFLPPSLDFEKLQFPPDFAEFKNTAHTFTKGENCYDFTDQNLLEIGDPMGLKF